MGEWGHGHKDPGEGGTKKEGLTARDEDDLALQVVGGKGGGDGVVPGLEEAEALEEGGDGEGHCHVKEDVGDEEGRVHARQHEGKLEERPHAQAVSQHDASDQGGHGRHPGQHGREGQCHGSLFALCVVGWGAVRRGEGLGCGCIAHESQKGAGLSLFSEWA